MVPIHKICKCGKKFKPRAYQLKIGDGKYCSRLCSNKATAKRGKESCHWVGDEVQYWGIHEWLYTNFGKADRCEMPNCSEKSRVFQWSKIREKEYERKRENFWRLCVSCHNAYDMTEEKKEKISKSLKKWYRYTR